MTMGNRPCGRNAIFKCVAIIATVVTTFSCVACGNAADSGSTADKSAAQSQGKHEKVKKSATQGLDGARILPLLGGNAAYSRGDDADIFTEPLSRQGRALIFGAGHVARALAPVLKSIGLPVYVYDSRPALLSREYFPDADGLICGGFAELSKSAGITHADAVFVMTPGHEADYDVLLGVLPSRAHYIGCIGSRHKAARTRERLRLAGFSGDDIARVRCPVGFNIGAETPAEIAVSIAAELIAVNSGAGGVMPWPSA